MNRKYLSYNQFEGLKFKADFVKGDEFVELIKIDGAYKIRFINSDKYISVKDDSSVDVTDKYAYGTFFQIITRRYRYYTEDEATILTDSGWFNLSVKNTELNQVEGGYWNIQNEIGSGRVDTLRSLGYDLMYRTDQ